MSSKRKRVMAKKTLPPMYIQNPQYQPVHSIANNQSSGYFFYPVDSHGNIIGQPLNHPPVANHYQPGSYPDWYYQSNRPIHDPRQEYPPNPPIIYDNSHQNYPYLNYYQPFPSSQSLPPIRNQPLTSTRMVSPNGDSGFQAFNVTNLTDRRSPSSSISSREALDKIKYYDKPQKTYH